MVLSLAGLAGCSSAQTKRKEQQTQVVKTSKIYCEFVNGENQQDVDVVLNLQMGAKCDYEKPYSVTGYKTPADITGVMFCCGVVGDKTEKKAIADAKSAEAAKSGAEAKKEIPVIPPPLQNPVPELPINPAPESAPAATSTPAPKVEERKPNSVKPKPQPAAKAPAKVNPYSDLDL